MLAKIHENGVQTLQPTMNRQMIRAEPCEEDPKVKIMLQSGTMTREDKGKQPVEGIWVHKALEKETELDLESAKETFMEAKKIFVEASTSGSQEKPVEEMDPSMLTTFLETCMKLLHDSNDVKGLRELINWCACKDRATSELYMVRKLGKHKSRIERDMRLTVQIREYEMDQVILDLGFDVNVLPK